MSFQIVRNDITKVHADAIVNTANPKPTYGSGTDQAVYEAAGKEKLLAERQKIGNIARGEAVETPAFALPATYIIHTVGPVWQDGNSGEFDILRACYENSLQLALKLKCKSIAFPLIATGVYGFPKDKALQIAMAVIQQFVMEHDMKVILVVFDKKAFELSGAVVDHIREYVDANYVEQAHRKEYASGRSGRNAHIPAYEDSCYGSRVWEETEAEESLLFPEALKETAYEQRIAPVNAPKPKALKPAGKKKVDIGKMIAASEKTFQEKLFEIIDSRGLTGPQVYKNYVSKQVFSKIQSDKNYHPNKATALALCLSLHLDLEETKDLIGRAGWTLSPSSKADLVVAGCIMNEEYNLVQVNIILFEFDCPELDKIK